MRSRIPKGTVYRNERDNNMRHGHKVLAFMLAFSMVAAACGSDDAEEAATAAPATAAPATAAPATAAPATAAPATTAAAAEAADGGCVGLVTDVGQVDDKSFNQSAWDGVQAAGSSLGVDVDYIETQAAKDYETNIGLFADSGCDVIVTVGFALGEATAIAAGEYPDVDFIGVDQFQGAVVDNVAGLIFPEDQAGFLAGALAASISTSGVIAEVLGTDLVPPVVAFGEGFVNGAKHINPGVQVIKTYHPGGLDVAFTDPEWGATTARQALDQGADVVFGAGGKTGNGALIEVAGEAGAFCIGVDTDQWDTVPEAHPCLVSSAMKLITDGVVDLISQSFGGSMPGGNYVGNVGLAGFHDHAGSVPGDVQDMLVALKADLESGAVDACVWSECDTPVAYDFGVTEDVVRIGAIADLSGPFAPLVIQIVDAQTAYWDMVNESGGIAGRQVEFIVLDNAYDVPTHLERYEVMRDEDEGVVFLSQSTGSPHTAAIAEALIEDGLGAIPLSWYSGWPDPDFGKNVFESYTNYCYESINAIDYIANNIVDGETKLAVVSLPGEYGQDGARGAKIAAEALGIEIVYDGEAGVIPGADQTPVITGLLESGANLVWATVTPGTFAEIFGGAGAQGFTAQWSGNSPTYNYMLLATPLAPLLDAFYTQSTYTLTWNNGDAQGMADMVAELQARIPDKPLSDVYTVGWTEAMATHQILEAAAAAGDMTRAGVIAAANSTTVDYNGLTANQSYGGDANDYVVRESYVFDIQADLFDPAATVAGGGSTGSVLLGDGPIVSDVTKDQVYEGACFVGG